MKTNKSDKEDFSTIRVTADIDVEDEIGVLVRDLTKVGSIPKSEARRRILELIAKADKRAEVRGLEKAREIISKVPAPSTFPSDTKLFFLLEIEAEIKKLQ